MNPTNPQGPQERGGTRLIEWITLLVIVVTASIYGWQTWIMTNQMRQTTDALRQSELAEKAQIINQSLAHSIEYDKVMMEKPYLRPYFYGKKERKEGDKDYLEALALAEMTVDMFDTIVYEMRDLKDSWPDPRGWENWMRDSFTTSPILRQVARDEKNWYAGNTRMYELLEEGEKAK